jgi:hypothetical protein
MVKSKMMGGDREDGEMGPLKMIMQQFKQAFADQEDPSRE